MYGMVVSGDRAVYQSVDYLPILWRFRMCLEDIDLIHKQFYKILRIILHHHNQLGNLYFIRWTKYSVAKRYSYWNRNFNSAGLFDVSYSNSFLRIQRNTNALQAAFQDRFCVVRFMMNKMKFRVYLSLY